MFWFLCGVGVGIWLEQSYHFPKVQPYINKIRDWEKENKKDND